jgi:hypothetical protein
MNRFLNVVATALVFGVVSSAWALPVGFYDNNSEGGGYDNDSEETFQDHDSEEEQVLGVWEDVKEGLCALDQGATAVALENTGEFNNQPSPWLAAEEVAGHAINRVASGSVTCQDQANNLNPNPPFDNCATCMCYQRCPNLPRR